MFLFSYCFFLPPCLHCLCPLRHWSSLYLCLSLRPPLTLSTVVMVGGGVEKNAENLLSEQNAVSSHVILVCMLHIVLHAHLLQLLHSTANVSEQITLTGFWGCPWVSWKFGMTGVKRGLQRRLTGREGSWKGAAFDDRIRVCFFSYLFWLCFNPPSFLLLFFCCQGFCCHLGSR